jgi:DNA modification methylase
MEFNRLSNKDCIAGMNELPVGSVDLAFADPPFNIGYTYDVYEDRMAADEYLAWTRRWGQAVVRCLKPNGTFWLAIGDDFAAELKLLFQRDLGLFCRSWVIWYYTFGVNCKFKFSRSHTHLFYFVKDRKHYTFNHDTIRVPSARQLVYADVRADSRGRLPDDTWILRPQDLAEGFKPDEDTWYIPRVCGTFKERAGWHGCQMPEQLLGRIIRLCSNAGEVVLDPFGGSGTSLVVAKKLGRKYLGFELSPNYAAQIEKRLESANEGDTLLGAEEPKVSVPATAAGKTRQPAPPRSAVIPTVTRRTPDDVNRAVLEAFFAVRDGFPVDRVIADPDLNSRFLDTCIHLGLPGEPRQWNHRLFNLRKAGYLKGLPRSRETVFPMEEAEFDRYKFACEIAIQKFSVEGNAFDEVLCDPKLAQLFDQTVLSMLPVDLPSLRIRWYAFRLRKRAKKNRENAAGLATHLGLPRVFESPFDVNGSVPATPGLYWLQTQTRHLYVGEARNLRERFTMQFGKTTFDFWGNPRASLKIGFRSASDEDARIMEANQSIWVERWKPVMNWEQLAKGWTRKQPAAVAA